MDYVGRSNQQAPEAARYTDRESRTSTEMCTQFQDSRELQIKMLHTDDF